MTELIDWLKLQNIHLKLKGDDLEIKFPGKGLPEDVLEKLRTHKQQLIEHFKAIKQNNAFSEIVIFPAPVQENYPLSASQQRFWSLSQFEGATAAYNTYAIYDIEGALDETSFEASFQHLVMRHEILRTVFRKDIHGEVRQFILDDSLFVLECKDISAEPASAAGERIKELTAEIIPSEFDLEKGPLLRARLIRVAPGRTVFIYNMHHIISDGWSLDIMMRELLQLYDAFSKKNESTLAPLKIQYKDYAVWERHLFNSEKLQIAKNYWNKQFEGDLPLLDLPVDKSRPPVKSFNGSIISREIDKEKTAKLRKFSQQQGGTMFMGALSLLNLFLYKHTGQDTIIVGSPFAGRNNVELENQLGCYINTLAYKTALDPAKSFRSLFADVKRNVLDAARYWYYPFDQLAEDIKARYHVNRSVIFDVLLNFESRRSGLGNDVAGEEIDGFSVQRLQEDSGVSKFDLTFHFSELKDTLHIGIEYNTDLFMEESAQRFIAHLNILIDEITEYPDKPLQEINCLDKAEREQLLLNFNDTTLQYAKNKTLTDLFEEQVLQSPDAIALLFNEKKLTYTELNEKANQFAAYLEKNYEVRADDLVGLKLERSDKMIIALLGILKSGAAYVPVDPGYPAERIEYMQRDSGCKVMIDEDELQMFEMERSRHSKNDPPKINNADSLAYVIYTSGSTGQPKGVMIEHRSVVNYMHWALNTYIGKGRKGNFGLFTSLSFDLTVTSIFSPLLSGGTLTVFAHDMEISKILDLYLQKESGLDIIKLTPSHIHLLENQDAGQTALKKVIVGGEELKSSHISILRKINPEIGIYNEYGPTESTVGSTVWKVPEKFDKIIIGRPICNTAVFIVGKNNELLPIGVAGEICISGDGLARGYLNKPELTAEKFIQDPFRPEGRMYKTGDLGKWLPDGTIEYTGRMDDQVKIRGYRIELGEIENALLSHKDVNAAVVIVKEEAGEKSLAAYISGEQLNRKELRSWLIELLPDHMLPEHFILVKHIPLTANGKVDKKMLQLTGGAGLETGTKYVAPQNELEWTMAEIWSEVLGIEKEKIGINDNFFDLGGNSLKALRIANQVYLRLKVKIELNELLLKQDIKQISEEISDIISLTTRKERSSKQII